MSEREDRPVLTGLVALLAVAAVVGLVVGLVAVAGVRILGIGGGGDSAAGSGGGGETLYLPTPKPTDGDTGALITLPSDPTPQTSGPAKNGGADREIELSAGQTSVSSMERIDLAGSYPGGDGAILQVQRFEDGEWTDFPVTIRVTGDDFTSYVMTSQAGVNRFRVIDTDKKTISTVVKVTVG